MQSRHLKLRSMMGLVPRQIFFLSRSSPVVESSCQLKSCPSPKRAQQVGDVLKDCQQHGSRDDLPS